jgi:predicted aspartyl protease
MYVDLEVSRDLDGPYETVAVEIDTGSDDSSLPRAFLKKIGVRPLGWEWYALADGRQVRRRYGVAFLRLRGELGATRVIFCGPKDAPVLGHIALEELGFTLDMKRGGLRKYRRQMISVRRTASRRGLGF